MKVVYNVFLKFNFSVLYFGFFFKRKPVRIIILKSDIAILTQIVSNLPFQCPFSGVKNKIVPVKRIAQTLLLKIIHMFMLLFINTQ